MAEKWFPNSDRVKRFGGWLLPLALLAIHAGLLFHSLHLHSVCVDEAAHVPSGLMHWHTGQFAAYRVNPPLTRMLATLPLLGDDVHWVGEPSGRHPDPFARVEWHHHRGFYQWNQERYHESIFRARWAGVLWSCLGGWLVFYWARELYGSRGGILALVLWCFEPNILAHAQVVTPDLPCSVAGLLAIYIFQHYLKMSSWSGALLSGMALGLALLTKFTLIVLLPVCLVLLLAAPRLPLASRSRALLVRSGHAALAITAMLVVINLGYLFEGSGRRLGDIPFVSRTFAGPQAELDPRLGADGAGNRFRGTWLGSVPVPVPEDWLRGIDVQRRDFEILPEIGPSYLRGEWRGGGWWYYYLYALGVKLPLGILALILAGLLLAVLRHHTSAPWRDELTIYLPAVAIITLVSSQTGFNHHLRYVLPALPFLLVGAGKLGRLLRREYWIAGAFVLLLAGWAAFSSLRVYPHSLSYFNEAAGGPENGHAHLLDSNIDWGQDVFFLKRWMDEHPEARPMRMAVFSFVHWDITGQQPLYPPSDSCSGPSEECGPEPGWYAISVNALRGKRVGSSPSCTYFQNFQPVARIGYSIYIYHLGCDECNRVREACGRPRLP